MDKADKIQQLYTICHADYDLHMSKTGHYDAQEKILQLLAGQIHQPILDLACGTGFLIAKLSKNFFRVFGNDFSPEMCEIASKKTGAKITNEDAEVLNSYNQKFQTIICCNLFFYLQNRDKAINRWANLLETNGKIIFFEEYPFVKPASEEMDKHTEELMSLINPISPKDIQNLMAQNGFKMDEEVKTKIDEKHDLFGLVFSLKKPG